MQLTKNFHLSEFLNSEKAKKNKINNSIPKEDFEVITKNLKKLCEEILQPLRDFHKEPITILSGFRNEELNELVGGSKKSQHKEGKASDITGGSLEETSKLYHFIKESFEFDQIKFYRERNFIHVSYNKGKNRKQVLT